MPHIDALRRLYAADTRPRQGELMMVTGRSGAQKSGFALWLALNWGLPTLYFSADMNAFQASTRIACSVIGEATGTIERYMADDGLRQGVLNATRDVPITFSFGSPITWHAVDAEIQAWVELYNGYPPLIVIDNLMDFDGATGDYGAQQDTMQGLSDLSRNTGSSVLVLHHASDKTERAKKGDPGLPPSRACIKNGMSEKPELILGVALDPHSLEFNVATLKQRMGACDSSGDTYVSLQAIPSRTRFIDPTMPPEVALG